MSDNIEIEVDIFKTRMVMSRHFSENYSGIFPKSNERIEEMFSYIDLQDKDVLSVLFSGDQALHCYQNGAKKVDVFDKNKLAGYYYYLRIWSIKYFGQYYMDEMSTDEYIKKLLKRVEPNTPEEQMAYNYWNMCISHLKSQINYDLFSWGKMMNNNINKIDDCSTLKRIFNNFMFKFYNIDISKDVSEIDNKYDVIIASSTSEFHVNLDRISLETYRDNLYGLLKENGIVLSTNFLRSEINPLEKRIFQEKFSVKELPKTKSYFGDTPVLYTRYS